MGPKRANDICLVQEKSEGYVSGYRLFELHVRPDVYSNLQGISHQNHRTIDNTLQELLSRELERLAGRYYPALEPGEVKFLEREAEKHGVTTDILLETATLEFLKTHDKKLYREAKRTADPQTLELLEEKAEKSG